MLLTHGSMPAVPASTEIARPWSRDCVARKHEVISTRFWRNAMADMQINKSTVTDELPGLVRALVGPGIAASIGSAATFSSVDDWYQKLDKPSFNPPRWVFGPAWSTLYLLMGIADFIVSREGSEAASNARGIYRAQLALNAVWSVLFFGLRSPLAALIEIAFLWVAILMTIVAFWRVSKPAALLLVPYLLWTTFATVLNASIWHKNR
jgi:tryptophan-rich sensory protein